MVKRWVITPYCDKWMSLKSSRSAGFDLWHINCYSKHGGAQSTFLESIIRKSNTGCKCFTLSLTNQLTNLTPPSKPDHFSCQMPRYTVCQLSTHPRSSHRQPATTGLMCCSNQQACNSWQDRRPHVNRSRALKPAWKIVKHFKSTLSCIKKREQLDSFKCKPCQ